MDYHERRAKLIIKEGLAKCSQRMMELEKKLLLTENPYATIDSKETINRIMNEIVTETYQELMEATHGIL